MDNDASLTGLGALPTEMLLEVASHFATTRDINSLAKVNRRFYQTFDPYLYEFEIRADLGRAMPWAVAMQQPKTLAKILEANPPADRISQEYTTASGDVPPYVATLLYHAVCNRSEEIVEMLLMAGATQPEDPELGIEAYPIEKATELNDIHILDLLLGSESCMIPTAGIVAMRRAVAMGHDSIFAMLMDYYRFLEDNTDGILDWIEYGAFEAVCGSRAPDRASTLRMVEYLFSIDPEENWRSRGDYYLHTVCATPDDNLDLAKLLIDQGVSPRQASPFDEHWPVCKAMWARNSQIVKYLIGEGHFSMQCIDSGCLLHHACRGKGYAAVESAKMILQLGANIAARYNEPPLFLACKYGNSRLFDFLIANGAEISKSFTSGHGNALHVVCSGHLHHGCLSIAKWLLENGVDHMEPDEADNTPLHMACQKNQLRMIRLLLDHGADPIIQSKVAPYGTPFDRAWENQHIEAVDMLLANVPRRTFSFPARQFQPRGDLHTFDMALRLKQSGVPIQLRPYFNEAVAKGNLEIMLSLTDRATYPHFNRRLVFEPPNPVRIAVMNRQLEAAKICLELGHPIMSSQSETSRTHGPFQIACKNEDAPMLELLLSWQMKPSLDLIRGLCLVAQRGNVELVKSILRFFHVNVYEPTCTRESFFTIASNAGQTLVMEALGDYAEEVRVDVMERHRQKPLLILAMLDERVCRSCRLRRNGQSFYHVLAAQP